MMREAEDGLFDLEKGQYLINNKYQVLSKIGTGSFSTVHAASVIKGQKQLLRAIKVVPWKSFRRAATSKNHRSKPKLQC